MTKRQNLPVHPMDAEGAWTSALAETQALERAYAEADAFDRRMAEAEAPTEGDEEPADEMGELRKAGLSRGQP